MRKIRRNMLKVKLGTNNITAAWDKLQQQKYGKKLHRAIVSQCKRSVFSKILSIARRALV